MEIKKIDHEFSVYKVADYSQIDIDREYVFTGRTDEERSLVCITGDVPVNVTDRDDGWKAFRIQGILDFSLIGPVEDRGNICGERNRHICSIDIQHGLYPDEEREL